MAQGRYVALHIGTGPSHAELRGGSSLVVTGASKFELTDDIWIERLDEQLAIRIQTACETRHYKVNKVPEDGHLYAFLRNRSDPEVREYEGLSDLHMVRALSRLVRPTSADDRYSALMFDVDVEDSPIQAIELKGINPCVFTRGGRPDWLTLEDGSTLRELMPWLSDTNPMHDRVRRAFWNHEYLMRSYHLDARWPLAVSGIEALLNVGRDNNKGQFRKRGTRLANELGISITDEELEKAYDLRSKLVHSTGFLYELGTVVPQGEHHQLYEKLEDLLRAAVKKSLLDANFGDHFRDDQAVNAHFPMN